MLGRFLMSLTARNRLTVEEAARRASLRKRKALKMDLSETPEASPQGGMGFKRSKADGEVVASLPVLGETSVETAVDMNAFLPTAVYEKLSKMEEANMLSHCAEHILQV